MLLKKYLRLSANILRPYFVYFSFYEDVLVTLYKKYLHFSANTFYKHSLTRMRVSVKNCSCAGFLPNTS